MQANPPSNNFAQMMKQPWVLVLLLALCVTCWSVTRFSYLFAYQMPGSQTVHPNFNTFREMSQSWQEGEKLGVINLNRMVMNNKRGMFNDYMDFGTEKPEKCTYLSLDPGYAVILTAIQWMAKPLNIPDSHLPAIAAQLVFDVVMLFAIVLTFYRWGILPAMAAGLLYGAHPILAYQAIYPFQYFWEGWLFAFTFLSLVWLRRNALANRQWMAVILTILIALAAGFGLWLRSTSLVIAALLVISFFLVPSLRRYSGLFIFIFCLTILPQVVRSSSAAGHFAISTRMSWHTALHGLGQYPNPHGIEDDDTYAMTRTQNEHGVKYNYCDYSKHDMAAREIYMDLFQKDPGFIIRAISARIFNNIIFNYDFYREGALTTGVFFVGLVSLFFALRRRGEALFVMGFSSLIYAGYCFVTALVFYVAPPYAYVTQLSLLMTVPMAFVLLQEGAGRLLRQPAGEASPVPASGKAPLAKIALALLAIIVLASAVVMVIPASRQYFMPKIADQIAWDVVGRLNVQDNKKQLEVFNGLKPDVRQKLLAFIRQSVPKTDNPEVDFVRYLAENYFALLYVDRHEGQKKEQHTVLVPVKLNADILAAVKGISGAIQGWDVEDMTVFDVTRPETWQGDKIFMRLRPTPDRLEDRYQQQANEKFARYNFEKVTWISPNELVAQHNGKGCDALRAALAVYYMGHCEYDPKANTNAGAPDMGQGEKAKK